MTKLQTSNIFLDSTPISFNELFGNDHPVEVEIGCGKGKFLLQRAEVSPEINFIGVDWARKWLGVGELKGKKSNLPNLLFFREHALEWISRLPENSISVFHIYFPDPWPKRRHHRRRLISEAFLILLHTKLRSDGCIEIATDDRNYDQHIQRVIHSQAEKWNLREGRERLAYPMFKTHYEIKYEAEGRLLHYRELEKALEV